MRETRLCLTWRGGTAFKIGVGVKPNGLAFDASRGILIVANVGDPSIPGSHAVFVDVGRRERIAEIKVPGRTRWAVYDPARETFFVNIASPSRIVAIEARNPTGVARDYEVPAAGPHGLDLDPATGRLLCACDVGALVAIEPVSGRRGRRGSLEWRPGCDLPASGDPPSVRGYRRPGRRRRGGCRHDAPCRGGADRGRRPHPGPRPQEAEDLRVPSALASCRRLS